MAHLCNGKGPYPDKAGEFCVNYYPRFRICRRFDETFVQAEQRHREWLAQMKFGKPENCKNGTSEELAARGWVGLYLAEDRELLSFETRIETNELMEEYVAG